MLEKSDAGELLSRAFGAAPGHRAGTRYVALAGELGLRWIIPSDAGAAGDALAAWAPYKRTTRLGWRLVTLAAEAGLLTRIPGAVALTVDLAAVDWSVYGWSHPVPPQVVTYVGTPGDQQKLVCSLVNRESKKTELVLKFPVGATASDSMARELAVLRTLERAGLDIAPKAVREGDGASFTVQTYLSGVPDWVDVTPAHVGFLTCLIERDRSIAIESLRERLQARQNKLADQDARAAAAIDRLLAKGRWGGTIPSVRRHGDFAPWNLKRRTDCRIQAVDWEDSAEGALPYYDLHHFQRSVLFRLGRRASVPWAAYTAALRAAAPTLSDEGAATVREFSAIEHWFDTHWARGLDCEAGA